MRKNILCVIIFFALIFIFSAKSDAVTMSKTEVKCPVCGTANMFMTLNSWGSYVYEKFPLQLVNWPVTRSFPHYICKNCKYAALSDDFTELPENKIEEVKKVLSRITFNETFDYYEDVPISKRLEAAETVYSVLEKDDEFRGWFYRIMAYHYDSEKLEKKAEEARRKALSITTKMLVTEKNSGERKWLLLTSGAMKHFLNDDNGALADFKTALKLRIPEKRYDDYYSEYLMEFIKTILKAEKEQTIFKRYYEMGTVYFIKTFRMGPLILLYSFLAWILFLIVPFLVGGGIRLLPGTSDKKVLFKYISAVLFVVFMALGTYLFLKGFDLSGSILPASIIGLTWLAFTVIFQRVVKRKYLDNKGVAGYLKGITESRGWKAARILIFVMPMLTVPALAFTERPEESLESLKLMDKGFTTFFHTGWEILTNSIGVWLLGYASIFLVLSHFEWVTLLFYRPVFQ